MNNNYIFSIVITIYNSEKWIRKAIESVIAQTINFKNIQLILVNDGSNDKSLDICKKYKKIYPNNIEIINKTHNGVASSRNIAIPYIKGKYVEFLDSDDYLSKDVLDKVYSFFYHNKTIDIVSIPMYYFEGRKNEHYLNEKFKKGNRVINLEKQWKDVFVHINSIFIKYELLKKYKFDESLVTCEDGKIVIQMLLEKQKYGVVSDCKYNYRFRNDGNSLSQTAKKNEDWYIKQMINYPLWAYQYCKEKIGYIPKFVKYMIALHLQWRFKKKDNSILKYNDEIIYKNLLVCAIKFIDDEIIDSLIQITNEEKREIKKMKTM